MMERLITNKKFGIAVIAFLSTVYVSQAQAIEYRICAKETISTMPDGTKIPMWGYALDNNRKFSDGCGNPVTVPGPEIIVPKGDSTLVIRLKNELPEATSFIVHGQKTQMKPVFFTDAKGRKRVKSLTRETSPGAIRNYTWTNFKPGSYLYQSGTHASVQVQMGLYGLIKKDAGTKRIYSGNRYDKEITLFYSEIDPALHTAVDNKTYGTPSFPSTQNYNPKYFLVNGQPFDSQNISPIDAGKAGDRLLVRFVNSGLEMHAPMFNDLYMNLIAEDGNLYPYARNQYSVMLAPSKTKDAIIVAGKAGESVVYDRRLRITNSKELNPGGHIAVLKFTP